MAHTTSDSTTELSQAPRPEAEELGLTVTQIFRTPLAALRASMESLQRELGVADPRSKRLEGALQQVLHLSRDVQTLADYAAPRPLAPLACSLEELVRGSLIGLDPQALERLSIARPVQGWSLYVDGPLFSIALTHLLEVALGSTGGEVLLRVQHEGEHSVFTIVDASDGDALQRLEQVGAEDATPKDASLGLGFHLAQRDLQRMGAVLTHVRTPRGANQLDVRVPNRPAARDSGLSNR